MNYYYKRRIREHLEDAKLILMLSVGGAVAIAAIAMLIRWFL